MASELQSKQILQVTEEGNNLALTEQVLQESEYATPYVRVGQELQVPEWERPYLEVRQVLWIAEYELVTTPPTVTLVANPAQISLGASSVLTYGSQWAVTLSLDNGIGSVTVPSGTVTVTPSVTTTYTITAVNPYGSATATATVIVVTPGPTPPTPGNEEPKGYFRIYQNDCEFRARSWGNTGAYVVMKPIGGPSVQAGESGAKI